MPVLSSSERRAALATLGLEPGASLDEITSAYRRLAKVTHPDVNATAGTDQAVRFAAVNLAYRLLSPRPSSTAAVRPQPEPQPQPARVAQPVPIVRVQPRQSWGDRPLVVAGPVIVTPARPTPSSRPAQQTPSSRPAQPTEVSQSARTTRSARRSAPEQAQ